MKLQTLVLLLILLVIPVSSYAVVFWDEDWEESPDVISNSNNWWDSSCAPGTWPSTSNPGLSTTYAYTGTKSLKHHFAGHQPLGGGCYVDKYHPYTTEVYVRWMEYIVPGFQFDPTQTKTIKPGDNYGSHWWAYQWGINQMIFACQVCKDALEGPYGTQNLFPNMNTNKSYSPIGKWFCYESRIKYNDPGVANGIIEAWLTIDGLENQIMGYYNREMKGPSISSPLSSNAGFIYVREYVQDGIGDIYRDRLAVGNTRIGCPGAPPPDTTSPFDITSITVTPGSTFLDISWGSVTDNPNGAVTYTLESCTGTLCSNFGNAVTVNGTNHTISALGPNVTMRFRVKAVDGSGNPSNNWSPIGSGTTPTVDITAPGKPSNLTVR